MAADQIEKVVIRLLAETLSDQDQMVNLFSDEDLTADCMVQLYQEAVNLAWEPSEQTNAKLKDSINTLVHRIDLKAEIIAIQIKLDGLCDLMTMEKLSSLDSLSKVATKTINAPLQFKKCGVETKLVICDR